MIADAAAVVAEDVAAEAVGEAEAAVVVVAVAVAATTERDLPRSNLPTPFRFSG